MEASASGQQGAATLSRSQSPDTTPSLSLGAPTALSNDSLEQNNNASNSSSSGSGSGSRSSFSPLSPSAYESPYSPGNSLLHVPLSAADNHDDEELRNTFGSPTKLSEKSPSFQFFLPDQQTFQPEEDVEHNPFGSPPATNTELLPLQQKLAARDETIKSLRASLDEMRTALASLSTASRSHHQSIRTELNNYATSLASVCDRVLSSVDSYYSSEDRQELLSLRSQLVDAYAVIDSLKEDMSSLEVKALEAVQRASESSLSSDGVVSESHQRENELLRQQIDFLHDEFEREAEKLSRLRAEAEKISDELDAKTEELESVKQQHAEEVEALQCEYRDLKQEVIRWKEESEHQSQDHHTKIKLNQMQLQVDQARSEAAELTGTLKLKHMKEMESLSSENKKLGKLVESIKKQSKEQESYYTKQIASIKEQMQSSMRSIGTANAEKLEELTAASKQKDEEIVRLREQLRKSSSSPSRRNRSPSPKRETSVLSSSIFSLEQVNIVSSEVAELELRLRNFLPSSPGPQFEDILSVSSAGGTPNISPAVDGLFSSPNALPQSPHLSFSAMDASSHQSNHSIAVSPFSASSSISRLQQCWSEAQSLRNRVAQLEQEAASLSQSAVGSVSLGGPGSESSDKKQPIAIISFLQRVEAQIVGLQMQSASSQGEAQRKTADLEQKLAFERSKAERLTQQLSLVKKTLPGLSLFSPSPNPQHNDEITASSISPLSFSSSSSSASLLSNSASSSMRQHQQQQAGAEGEHESEVEDVARLLAQESAHVANLHSQLEMTSNELEDQKRLSSQLEQLLEDSEKDAVALHQQLNEARQQELPLRDEVARLQAVDREVEIMDHEVRSQQDQILKLQTFIQEKDSELSLLRSMQEHELEPIKQLMQKLYQEFQSTLFVFTSQSEHHSPSSTPSSVSEMCVMMQDHMQRLRALVSEKENNLAVLKEQTRYLRDTSVPRQDLDHALAQLTASEQVEAELRQSLHQSQQDLETVKTMLSTSEKQRIEILSRLQQMETDGIYDRMSELKSELDAIKATNKQMTDVLQRVFGTSDPSIALMKTSSFASNSSPSYSPSRSRFGPSSISSPSMIPRAHSASMAAASPPSPSHGQQQQQQQQSIFDQIHEQRIQAQMEKQQREDLIQAQQMSLATLQERNHTLASKFAALELKYASVHDEAEKAQAVANTLQEALEKVQSEVVRLQLMLESAEREKEEEDEKQREDQFQYRAVAQQNETLRSELMDSTDQHRKEVDVLCRAIEKAEQKLEDEKNTYTELEHQFKSECAKLEQEMKTSLLTKSMELDEMSGELKQVQMELQSSQNKCNELECDLQLLKNELDQIRAAYEMTSDRCQDLEEAIERMESEYTQERDAMQSEAQAEAVRLRQDLMERRGAVSLLEQEKQVLTERLSEVEGRYTHARRQLEEADKECHRLRDSLTLFAASNEIVSPSAATSPTIIQSSSSVPMTVEALASSSIAAAAPTAAPVMQNVDHASLDILRSELAHVLQFCSSIMSRMDKKQREKDQQQQAGGEVDKSLLLEEDWNQIIALAASSSSVSPAADLSTIIPQMLRWVHRLRLWMEHMASKYHTLRQRYRTRVGELEHAYSRQSQQRSQENEVRGKERDELRAQVEALTQECAQLRQQLLQHQQQYQQFISPTKQQHQQMQRNESQDSVRVLHVLQAEVDKWRNLCDRYAREKSEASRQCMSIEEEKQTLLMHMHQLQIQSNTLKEELDACRKQVRTSSMDLQRSQQVLSKLQSSSQQSMASPVPSSKSTPVPLLPSPPTLLPRTSAVIAPPPAAPTAPSAASIPLLSHASLQEHQKHQQQQQSFEDFSASRMRPFSAAKQQQQTKEEQQPQQQQIRPPPAIMDTPQQQQQQQQNSSSFAALHASPSYTAPSLHNSFTTPSPVVQKFKEEYRHHRATSSSSSASLSPPYYLYNNPLQLLPDRDR